MSKLVFDKFEDVNFISLREGDISLIVKGVALLVPSSTLLLKIFNFILKSPETYPLFFNNSSVSTIISLYKFVGLDPLGVSGKVKSLKSFSVYF